MNDPDQFDGDSRPEPDYCQNCGNKCLQKIHENNSVQLNAERMLVEPAGIEQIALASVVESPGDHRSAAPGWCMLPSEVSLAANSPATFRRQFRKTFDKIEKPFGERHRLTLQIHKLAGRAIQSGLIFPDFMHWHRPIRRIIVIWTVLVSMK